MQLQRGVIIIEEGCLIVQYVLYSYNFSHFPGPIPLTNPPTHDKLPKVVNHNTQESRYPPHLGTAVTRVHIKGSVYAGMYLVWWIEVFYLLFYCRIETIILQKFGGARLLAS